MTFFKAEIQKMKYKGMYFIHGKQSLTPIFPMVLESHHSF